MKTIIRNSDILEMKEELLESLSIEINRAEKSHYSKHIENCQLEMEELKKEITELKETIASSYDGKDRRTS